MVLDSAAAVPTSTARNKSTFYWTLMDVDFFAISCSPDIELEDGLATYSLPHGGLAPVVPSFHEADVDATPIE